MSNNQTKIHLKSNMHNSFYWVEIDGKIVPGSITDDKSEAFDDYQFITTNWNDIHYEWIIENTIREHTITI